MNSPAEIARIYSDVGAAKTRMPFAKLFLLSIFAGAFIALGALGSTIAGCGVNPPAVGKLFSAVIFPVGLTMVLIAGSELFTGNCLILLSVFEKKASVKGLIYNLCVVWIGNFVGAFFIAFLATYGHVYSLFDMNIAMATVKIAAGKCDYTFVECLLKGILCNIMVCIAVWMSFSSKQISGKILASFLPIIVFVLCNFEHCVANFYFIPAGLLAAKEYNIQQEGLSWLYFIIKNEIPVTLGNIIGGFLVAAGYWVIYLNPKKD